MSGQSTAAKLAAARRRIAALEAQVAGMSDSGAPARGLYDKFRVTRTDNRSLPGEKHHGCRYFVLDLIHDPLAKAAIAAYLLQLPLDSPLRRDLTEALPSMKGQP